LPFRIALGISAIAILIPANAFPGAEMLDWAGLGAALVLAGFDLMRSRTARMVSTAQTTP
jgi:hypothetical protein